LKRVEYLESALTADLDQGDDFTD